MSLLSDAVLRLEQENARFSKLRPFGNIVLRKRDGFGRGIDFRICGPYSQISELVRYQEQDFASARACSPSDHSRIRVTTYYNTCRLDPWGRTILEEV